MRAIVPWDVGSYPYAEINYANPHAVTSVGGATYTYDNNGNVSAIGSLDYTWDWRNRLASAERSGGGITSYGYDHTGQRVFQATGSATTSYPSRYYPTFPICRLLKAYLASLQRGRQGCEGRNEPRGCAEPRFSGGRPGFRQRSAVFGH